MVALAALLGRPAGRTRSLRRAFDLAPPAPSADADRP
jgi:hypothetical protein